MIAVGSDHAGFSLKTGILRMLEKENIPTRDVGTQSNDRVDYPSYGEQVALCVASGECEMGIAICGTGIGVSIVANKVPGIRAALCHDVRMARLARQHNDANVLALGGRVLATDDALEIVKVFLQTEFLGERHAERVAQIAEIEKKYVK